MRIAKVITAKSVRTILQVEPGNSVSRSQPLSASLNVLKLQQSTKQVSTLKLHCCAFRIHINNCADVTSAHWSLVQAASCAPPV